MGNEGGEIQRYHGSGPSRKAPAHMWPHRCEGKSKNECRVKCSELERVFVLPSISLLLKAKFRHHH